MFRLHGVRPFGIVGLAALLVTLAVPTAAVGAAPSVASVFAPSAKGRPILYVHSGDVYAVWSDGTGPVRLTYTGDNSQPTWAPDSTRFAFVSTRDGDSEIYVRNAAGTHRLTTNTVDDVSPAWSPDGEHLAFTRQFAFDQFGQPALGTHLWVMDAGGAHQHEVLAPDFGFFEDVYTPVWSPDGSTIVTAGNENEPTQDDSVFLWDLAGNPTFLLHGAYGRPSWTPNGDVVAGGYDDSSPTVDGAYEITPGALPQLLHASFLLTSPSFGSDGHTLAYIDRGGVLDAFDTTTSTLRQLATLQNGFAPGDRTRGYDWAPAGWRLVAAATDGLRIIDPHTGASTLLPVTGTDPDW